MPRRSGDWGSNSFAREINWRSICRFESGLPLLPEGIEKSEIPTVCFHPDIYAFTRKRIRWSYLFDQVAVYHPGYEKIFAEAGHPGAFVLPHAVRRDFYDGAELIREFEVGWVGQASGKPYRRRAEWLPRLAASFRMNDLNGTYSLEEVAGVYRRSRVVVNLGRDDFPQDANLRVFEVLASGALLLTPLPTELSELGFSEGEHFIGFRSDEEILPLVRRYLDDERTRARIGAAARAKALEEHTYDCRAVQLLQHLEITKGKHRAPASQWPERRARLMALDFFASHAVLPCAFRQYRRIAGRGFRETFAGAWLLLRAWLRYGSSAFRSSYKTSTKI